MIKACSYDILHVRVRSIFFSSGRPSKIRGQPEKVNFDAFCGHMFVVYMSQYLLDFIQNHIGDLCCSFECTTLSLSKSAKR